MGPAPDPDSGEVVYAGMRWNTPLSEEHAALLLESLGTSEGDEVLDLGCGWGELLARAVAAVGGTTGTGVDQSGWALERARSVVRERRLADRISFHEGDAAKWEIAADRVICIGASHAWGGTSEALRGLRRTVRPGGRLLYGDGCWERDVPPAAGDTFEEVQPLAQLVQEAVDAGWSVMHLSTADQREWDDFESTWRAGRQQWLLANREDRRSDEIRRRVDAQLLDYVSVYRGHLGFAYLVLAN